MSRDLVYVSPDDAVSKVISLIEEHCLREILVIENKKLKGIVYSKDIANKDIIDPTKTKVDKLIRSPPKVLTPDQSFDDAANLIFETGLRALPVVESGKVVGIVSLHDIVDVASKSKEFKQTTAEAIMSAPETIKEDADIGNARALMREKNISRLPILNKNEKLSGVVTIFDLLKAVKPRDRLNFYSMAGEKETAMGIPISTVMNTDVTKVARNASLSEVVGVMTEDETDGVIVAENEHPVGVITEKDLLEVYISSLNQKGVYYQISGLTNEDDFIVATADRMVQDTIQKMSRIITPQFFFLHVKKHDKQGRAKYSIRTRFLTNKGVFISKAFAWDLRDAINQALKNLERIMIKEFEVKRERNDERSRFKKMVG